MPDFSHHQLPFQNASSSEEDSDSDGDHETPSSYLRHYESPAGMKPIDRLDLSRQLKNIVVAAIVKAQRELESHFGELFSDMKMQIKASQEQNLELLNQTKDLKNQISRLHTELTGVKKRLQQPPHLTAAPTSPPQQTIPPAGPKQKATSYASAAAQRAKPAAPTPSTNTPSASKPTKQTLPDVNKRKFILLRNQATPLTATQQLDVKSTINKALKEADGPNTRLSVVEIKGTLRGNLEISTREDTTAEAVLKYQPHILPALQALPAVNISGMQLNTPWAKVAVHGVDLSFFPDNKEGMEKLQAEIQQDNPTIQLKALPRYLTSPAARANKTHSSIVLAVKDEHTAARIVSKGIYLLTTRLRASTYRAARPIDMCANCCAFGHHQDTCRREAQCRFCAEPHESRSHQCAYNCRPGRKCRHLVPKCANCEDNHLATDPECPFRLNKLQSYKSQSQGTDTMADII
jgi:hypothetical protein